MDSISITITEPSDIVLTITTDSVTCNGFSDGVAITNISGGTSPYNYYWSNGDSTIGSTSIADTISGLTSGTYFITVNDLEGCEKTDSLTIAEPPEINISFNIDSTIKCNGDSNAVVTATLENGANPYDYFWSNGDSTISSIDTFNTVNGISAGFFHVTINDANGCIKTDSINLIEPSALSISVTITTQISCFGDADGSIRANTMNTGVAPWDFIWSNGDTTLASSSSINDILSLAAGNYFVTITDSNGCSIIDSGNISEPQALILTPFTVPATCGLSDGIAAVSVNGGTGSYTYAWDDPFTQTTDTASGLLPGAYTVIVLDSNNCADSTTAIVTNLGGPSILTDSIYNINCNGDSNGAIYVSIIGGNLPFTYLWSTGDSTKDISNLSVGNYILTVTDSNNCVAFLDTSISEPIAITLSLSSIDAGCFGSTDGSATAMISGGVSPFTYLWSDPLAQTTFVASNLSAGQYNVSIIDSNGCSALDSISISQPSELVLAMSSINSACDSNSGSAEVSVSGSLPPYTYLWDDPGGQTNATAVGLSAGTYIVTVTDSVGCQNIDFISVESVPLIASTDPDISICNGESGQLFAYGGSNYSWSPSTGLSNDIVSNPIASPTVTTLYEVIVGSPGCVADTGYVLVSVYANPNIDAGQDIIIPIGTEAQLNGTGGITYSWTPSTGLSCTNCSDPIATLTENTTYILTGIDSNNCMNTDTINVTIDDDKSIFIPDVFSPNADNQNDLVFIQGKGIKNIALFMIFDRWGEKVYELENFMANDKTLGWDGKYKDEYMNAGVFVYYVKAVFYDDEVFTGKGDITLVQ